MNKKTKAFLDELVNLCLAHGVRVVSGEEYDSYEFYAGTNYRLETDGISRIRLNLDEIDKAITSARHEAKTPKPMLVYRHGKDPKKKQWLMLVGGECVWTPIEAKAQVWKLTLSGYMKLMTKLEKTDPNYRYAFGHKNAP